MFDINISDIYGDSEDENVNVHSYEITHININDLVLNELNFYNTDEIEDLKESILEFKLIQNLTVAKMEDGKYLILNGHRRYKALKSLLDEGRIDIDTIPCEVLEISEFEQRTMLVMANKTAREITPYEKMLEIETLTEIVVEVRKTKDKNLKERLLKFLNKILKKDNSDEIKGRTRDIVAEALNMSSSEVAKYEAINNNLTDEVKEEFKDGYINTDVAYKTSTLEPEQQKEVKEMIVKAKENDSKITAKDVDTVKEKHEGSDDEEKPMTLSPGGDFENNSTFIHGSKDEDFICTDTHLVSGVTDYENVSKLNTFKEVKELQNTKTTIHELKIDPLYFNDVISCRKTFEYRKDDRGFKVGDILHLREYSKEHERYTGVNRDVYVRVNYILKDVYNLPQGYVIMSIENVKKPIQR